MPTQLLSSHLQFKCSFPMLNTNQLRTKTLYISITELNCIIKVVPYEIVNIDNLRYKIGNFIWFKLIIISFYVYILSQTIRKDCVLFSICIISYNTPWHIIGPQSMTDHE